MTGLATVEKKSSSTSKVTVKTHSDSPINIECNIFISCANSPSLSTYKVQPGLNDLGMILKLYLRGDEQCLKATILHC